jgi:formylglycine-generating enzyme required for sulfatase activity
MKRQTILLGLILPLTVSTLICTSCKKDGDDPATERLTFDDGIELVFVEGGVFTQGSDGLINADEKPAHEVELSSYYIGKYEITQKQYFDVVGRFPDLPPVASEGLGDNFPIYYVTYADAQEFLTKLNAKSGKRYRLPTEAEWEYAARGGKESKGYIYSGSNDPYAVTKYYGTSGNTWEIGYSTPNELGIYDLSGNAYEWTSDWYAPYPAEKQTNPTGPASGTHKVNRGGTFINVPVGLRVEARYKSLPEAQEKFLGFRIAHSEK